MKDPNSWPMHFQWKMDELAYRLILINPMPYERARGRLTREFAGLSQKGYSFEESWVIIDTQISIGTFGGEKVG